MDSKCHHFYLPRVGNASRAALSSLGLLALLVLAAVWLAGGFSNSFHRDLLVVYCAAGARPPVEQLAASYEQEHGVPVILQYGSSGALLNQLEVESRGDLYIPADTSFIELAREKQLAVESIPLAELHLVLAVKPGNPRGIEKFDDLLQTDVRVGVANEQAAVGKLTRNVLESAGRWADLQPRLKVTKPTVTDIALDVKEGAAVDAALIWDSTARQFGLEIIELPELADGVSKIAATIIATSDRPAEALRFARYLAAPSQGKMVFKEHGYVPTAHPQAQAVPTKLHSDTSR